MNTVYTIGYSGSSHEDLRQYIKATGAILVDIRMSAFSRAPMWMGKNIEEAVGRDNYLYLKEFGNVNYNNDQPMRINEPLTGLARLLGTMKDTDRDVILMCGCREVEGCHRKVVAEFIVGDVRDVRAPNAKFNLIHLPTRFANWMGFPAACPNCKGAVEIIRNVLSPDYIAEHYPQYVGAHVEADMAACTKCHVLVPKLDLDAEPTVHVNGEALNA